MKQQIIRVAIAGYGNLGRGVENALKITNDMELVCIFTRRSSKELNIKTNVPIVSEQDIEQWKDKIDIVFLCGGSAKDLPIQGPKYAAIFNTVDSFDTHAKALEYSQIMEQATKIGNTIAMTSIGWDPGLFSNIRLMIQSILPKANVYTFWGKGVSQGHSDAIRRIKGVVDARQYTVPIESVKQKILSREMLGATSKQMHERHCFVVIEQGANKEEIEKEIKSMPDYFEGYHTIVNFVSYDELQQYHMKLAHGGCVVGVGETSQGTQQMVEYKLNLDSNPEFTASVLVAYGRATYRMWKNGERGYKNFSDVPPKYLIDKDYSEIIEGIL